MGIALVAATAGIALSVSCATSAAGPNDKYVHPTNPITDPVERMAFVCATFDRYGVRADVVEGMIQDLKSWGRGAFTKGVIDAAVYGECPQYMNSYIAVTREMNQSRPPPLTEDDRRPVPAQQAQPAPQRGSGASAAGSLTQADHAYIDTLRSKLGMTIGANRASYDRVIEQGHGICADLRQGAPADAEADYIYRHMSGIITQSQATGWVHAASVSYCPGLG